MAPPYVLIVRDVLDKLPRVLLGQSTPGGFRDRRYHLGREADVSLSSGGMTRGEIPKAYDQGNPRGEVARIEREVLAGRRILRGPAHQQVQRRLERLEPMI